MYQDRINLLLDSQAIGPSIESTSLDFNGSKMIDRDSMPSNTGTTPSKDPTKMETVSGIPRSRRDPSTPATNAISADYSAISNGTARHTNARSATNVDRDINLRNAQIDNTLLTLVIAAFLALMFPL